MASVKKQLITDSISKLRGLPEMAFVAKYNNQFEWIEDGGGYSFPMPCGFVELLPQDHSQLALGVTSTDVDVRIHIGHQELDAMDGSLDQNLDVFDLVDKVRKEFNLYQPEHCSHMFPVHEEQDYSHGNIYHYIIDFRCAVLESKGSPLDPEDGRWIEHYPPTALEVEYEVREVKVFNSVFNNVFA